jgi:hypothetical protein
MVQRRKYNNLAFRGSSITRAPSSHFVNPTKKENCQRKYIKRMKLHYFKFLTAVVLKSYIFWNTETYPTFRRNISLPKLWFSFKGLHDVIYIPEDRTLNHKI